VFVVTVVLGAQWGDEGKGKLVDVLAGEADVCARCAGGNNAGHTIVAPVGPDNVMKTFAFHLLPSGKFCQFHRDEPHLIRARKGLVNQRCTALVGNGVVVHVPSFFDELDALQEQGWYDESKVLTYYLTISPSYPRIELYRSFICL
jgi:adenylosuccinate synthase